MKKYIVSIIIALLPTVCMFAQNAVGNKAKQDLTLQDNLVLADGDFQFAKGDTIIIAKSQERYLTGEQMSNWVYYVQHTIYSVGGKRFPDGILVAGIMSWVDAKGLGVLLMGAVDRGDSIQNAAAQERMARDKEAITERRMEVSNLDDETKKNVGSFSKLEGINALSALSQEEMDRINALKRQQEEEMRRQDSIARAYADSVAQAYADSVAKAYADSLAAVAYADSVAKAYADSVYRTQQLDTTDETHLRRLRAEHRFSIGLRGGVASLMQETERDIMGRWKAGFDALLDLQYAYYFGAKEGQTCNLGIITGLSLGYSRSPLASGVDTAYTITDGEGEAIDYKVEAGDVNEKDGQLQLEIPILFSLRHESGVFFNVGPKLVVPVFAHYNQKITDPNIEAYFQNEGVTVGNEVITGKLQESQQTTKGKWSPSKINLMLTAELGYEWLLKNGDALGLGVYGNYSLYDLYKNDTDNKSLINVGMPEAGGAQVDVLSATDTYATGLGFFDCGVKVVYHFCFPAKK